MFNECLILILTFRIQFLFKKCRYYFLFNIIWAFKISSI